jgi:diguanylate cyclase (GGDEF)-like protein/PAS domain S-box-containing protein
MENKNILVVEDESVVAMHIEESLEKLGYAVAAVVASGEEAVKKAEETRPDLILMDIVLKGEIDGIDAAGQIREKFNIPVIYLTAYADDAIVHRAKITEPLGYIVKPFNERELKSAIEIAIYKHEMETKLKKMERWLSITLRSIGDGVIATDKEMRVTFINKIAEQMTGWKSEDAIGKNLVEIFNIKNGTLENSEAVEKLLIEKVLKQGVILNLIKDNLLITRDRKEIPIEDSIAPIREDKDNIPGIVIAFRDISERKQLEETVRYQACHDYLTELPNKTLFTEHLGIELANAQRHNKKLAVLFLDIDRFKTINETLGHSIGDRLLKEVSVRLMACAGEADTVARVGGDEFGILLPDINHPVDAVVGAEKIIETFKTPYVIDGYELNVSTSIGISMYPDDGQNFEDLIKNADIAMDQAKEQGRSNYQFFNPAVNIRTLERITLENRMRQAVDRNELVLHYQAQLDLATKRIIGAEALVRWQHPELGLLNPVQFLSLAEETGYIKTVDSWVLRAACEQNKAWQNEGLPPVCVAVNLSAQQFQLPDLPDAVTGILKETALDPQFLDLEITENIAMKNFEFSVPNIKRLNRLGIRFSIDDFGTGYSSLSYLKNFHIQKLKIDKSFIKDIATDSDSKAIISAIIAMGHNLKLKVIAEGVETEEQSEFLRSMGCDEIQGYLFSKPLTADEFRQFLIRHSKGI